MKSSKLSLLLSLVLFGCSHEPKGTGAISTISIPEQVKAVTSHGNMLLEIPRSISQEGADIWVLDEKAKRVWHLARDGKVLSVFSGPGQGPGELGFQPTAIYLEDNQVQIIHDQGGILESFSRSGEYRDTRTFAPGNVLYSLYEHIIIKTKSGTLEWQKPDHSSIELTMIDQGTKIDNPAFLVSHSGNHIMICTQTSSENRIKYAILDLSNGEVLHHKGFETHLRLEKEDYPELPEGMVFNPFVLGGLTSSEELGFVLTEICFKLHEDHEGPFQAIQIVDPNTGKRETYRVKVGIEGVQTAFQHLSGSSWVAISERNGQINFFDMDLRIGN